MLFTKTAILSAMAALASAYTQPDYNKSPLGNAITKPGLNDLVTAGKPYTIEWKPDTEGPISLVLLRGPSTNAQPIDTLAEAIDNSGHFDWTPSSELEPDTTHYGLMIVVEGSGQYQYSTQFGVKNEEYGNSASSSSSSASASAPSSAAATTETAVSKGDGLHTIYSTEEFVTTRCPKCSAEASAASASATSTSAAPATTLSSIPVIGGTSSAAVSSLASVTPSSSSVAAATSTKASPSDAAAVTGSDSGSASSSAPSSVFTGAADRNTIGLGAVAAGMLAVFAF